jgi:hypothetical protein
MQSNPQCRYQSTPQCLQQSSTVHLQTVASTQSGDRSQPQLDLVAETLIIWFLIIFLSVLTTFYYRKHRQTRLHRQIETLEKLWRLSSEKQAP